MLKKLKIFGPNWVPGKFPSGEQVQMSSLLLKVSYLHDELLLWDGWTLLVVSVARQLLHKQTEQRKQQSISLLWKWLTTDPAQQDDMASHDSRDEFGVEDICVLQAALLQVNCRHALHLHAGAEVASRSNVLIDLHAAPHFGQGSNTLRRRQRYIRVVWLCCQLLLRQTKRTRTQILVTTTTDTNIPTQILTFQSLLTIYILYYYIYFQRIDPRGGKYREKRKGPSIEPWGTPQVRYDIEESTVLTWTQN